MEGHYDGLLGIGLAACGGLFSVVWWFVRRQFDEIDEVRKDVKTNTEGLMSREALALSLEFLRAKNTDMLDKLAAHMADDTANFAAIDKYRDELRRALHWQADCLQIIATTLKVQIPPRP